MKKQYLVLTMMLALGSPAYADSQFDNFIQNLHADRAQKEAQLGLDPDLNVVHASSFYDDWPDHFEKDQIMLDELGEGLN